MFATLSASASSPDLNEQQSLAVHHGDAPLLVIAGAGSGKTNTLAHRVAQLVVAGADPTAILLLTFSRRAAAEMERRVARIVGARLGTRGADAVLPWAGTFHAVGAKLLREWAPVVGLDPAFTIIDREDAADLMNLVRQERGLGGRDKRFPLKSTCLAIYSRVLNTAAPLSEVLARSFPWCAAWEAELKPLFAAYVAAKQAQNVLDYDDLLLYWAKMVAEPELGAQLGARFTHILVDEYQDTNRLQASILLGMKPSGCGSTVVGDDAQSIYAFRGATVRNILDFPEHFDPPAATVRLERNYRSTQPLLAAANAVIGLAGEGYAKQLWSARPSAQRPRLVNVRDEIEQARWVAGRLLERREAGIKLKSQATLFRASHHSAALELELARRNIPFVKFGGLKFLEATHIKDVLAVLRWAENPRDRGAGFRVLQLLPGIGPKTAGRILDGSAAANDPIAALSDLTVAAAAPEWAALVGLMSELRHGAWPADIERVRLWYGPHLERRHEDAAIRHADLVQLEKIAATQNSRERFLTELTLDPPEATSAEAGPPLLDEDYTILSTIHSAKGQEWSVVTILNVVDGCMPSDLATGSAAEIEEERRLLYVAMTRAKDELDLVVPQRFYVSQQSGRGDRHVYAGRTRFIPDSLLPQFEQQVWPPALAGDAAAPAAMAKVDLAARMRSMWD